METNERIMYYMERKILQSLLKCSDTEMKELSALLKKSKQYRSKDHTDLMNEFLVIIFKEGIHAFQNTLIENILYRFMDKFRTIEGTDHYLGMLKNLEVLVKITITDPLTQRLKTTVSLEEEKEMVMSKLIPSKEIMPIMPINAPLAS